MTPAPNDKLEARLARLTMWDDRVPDLWRDALDSSCNPASRPPGDSPLNWKVPRWVLGTTFTAAAVLLVVAIMHPALSGGRAKRAPAASPPVGLMSPSATDGDYELTPPAASWAENRSLEIRGRIDVDGLAEHRTAGGRAADMGDQEELPASSADSAAAPDRVVERQIVHKATMELETKDVRAAFLKAGQLVSEAGGEFVQDSALTGADELQMQGNLTLRVAASRLPAVLNELRGLGKVCGERNDGTDVTSQVVDLEARIRNEQCVEKELLELLESRKDAALKEILDLRANLASVRIVIEQLTAQRQNLSRLVSLATVLVIIRTDNAPPPEPPPPGIGTYFADAFSGMWEKGLRVLADTLATLLGTLVGGLPWWILLVVTALIVRGVMRKRTA